MSVLADPVNARKGSQTERQLRPKSCSKRTVRNRPFPATSEMRPTSPSPGSSIGLQSGQSSAREDDSLRARQPFAHAKDMVRALEALGMWSRPEQIIERCASGVADKARRGHMAECCLKLRAVEVEQAFPIVASLFQPARPEQAVRLVIDLIEPLVAAEIAVETVAP